MQVYIIIKRTAQLLSVLVILTLTLNIIQIFRKLKKN